MATHRCTYSAVLVTLCCLSLFLVAASHETTLPAGQHVTTDDNPQTVTETAEQSSEQSAVRERLWETTPLEDAAPGDAPADKEDTSTHATVVPASVAQPKDDFQEELIIRPLHSGDIYASFQFRTLWETDFRENKGMLTVSNL